jgi:hypothetical protein
MVKKLLLSALTLILFQSMNAKKVKFAVDMGTYTISPFGVHVIGDFQVAAGYSLNFDTGSLQMTQVGATTIYTCLVTIPAFQLYQFKFVNGNQSYEVEFVPDKARVGYNFNDNRWMYVDSLMNDTSYLGAIKFSGNAPAGKTLLRYVVDMANAGAVSSNGVHLGSTYQSNDPATTRLSNLPGGGSCHEIIAYIATGTQSFKYYNGKLAANTETVPGTCATGGLRTHNLTADTVLNVVCFSGCAACPVGLKENSISYSALSIYPNPASNKVDLQVPVSGQNKVTFVDVSGKIVKEIVVEEEKNAHIGIGLHELPKGFYQVYFGSDQNYYHTKLLVQ